MTEETQPEKFDLRSQDIAAEQREKLRQLFPEVFTEGGKVDFERLKSTLGDVVDSGKERYGMNWPGKAECFRTIQTPSRATLRPCREESVNFDTSENLIIEGDNLEVLKLLQKGYLGKVKMIYIDPPYNTGNDFIYPDNYSESLDTYLSYTGQVDADGRKFSTNPETDGRFHSRWLNMMYPRLFLARNLLREDGVIFVSIDDHECDNLRKICNEVFGEENFCAQFVWNTEGNTDNQYEVKVNHEYVLAYYRNITFCDEAIGRVIDPNTPKESNLWKGIADNNINKNNPANPPAIVELPVGFPSSEKELTYAKKNVDEAFFTRTQEDKFISDSVKARYGLESKSGLPVKLDDMIVKDFKLVKPCRIYVGMANRNKLVEFIENGCKPIMDEGTPLKFYINVNAGVRYLRENDKPRNVLSVLRGLGTTEKTRTYLKNLGITFDYPKPVGLLEYLVKVGCEGNDIVMDFFAGSGTTAEAVANLNATENANRRFVCVQLPEVVQNEGGRGDDQQTNIASLAKKRVKIVLQELQNKNPLFSGDLGVKVFKLDTSNFKPWDGTQPEAPDGVAKQLELHIEHVLPGRSQEDILTELLLKSGFPLSTKVEAIKLADKQVFSVEDGAMLVCLDDKLTPEVIKAMADKKPSRVICLDAGFQGNDQLKTNAVQTMKARGVLSFRTV